MIVPVVTETEIKMFGKKKHTSARPLTFDPEKEKPVIRASICTGEQVAGFKELATGKFHEVMLIRGEKDLKAFKDRYGITEISKEY